jgi:hypothetical protein
VHTVELCVQFLIVPTLGGVGYSERRASHCLALCDVIFAGLDGTRELAHFVFPFIASFSARCAFFRSFF